MGNLTLEDVNNMYLDVLKEIGNIGAGNATTAIANMLGMKIDMNVPNVKLMEVSKLGTAVGAEDETIVRNAEDLRNKESDRIKCLVNELTKIGVNIEETKDGFIVRGKKELSGGAELESYHDHRLAMSFYIAGLVCKNEIAINGFEWTNISFPEFEELMDNLI